MTSQAPTCPEVATYDQYCERRGVSSFAPIDAGMHSGRAHVSRQANRQATRLVLSSLAQWQEHRDALRIEYDQRCAEGSVRPPTRVERLEVTARGTGESAEAAKRILATLQEEAG